MCRADDVQVEFIMLDPYQRITMKHNNEVCPLEISPPLQSALVWNPRALRLAWHTPGQCFHACMYVCMSRFSSSRSQVRTR